MRPIRPWEWSDAPLGHPVSARAPVRGDIMVYDGTRWQPTYRSAAEMRRLQALAEQYRREYEERERWLQRLLRYGEVNDPTPEAVTYRLLAEPAPEALASRTPERTSATRVGFWRGVWRRLRGLLGRSHRPGEA